MSAVPRGEPQQHMPVHLRRHYLPCQSMCAFVACPLTHTNSSRLVSLGLSRVSNSFHRSAFFSLHFWFSPRMRLVAIRTTYSLSDLISRFPPWIFIAAMTANNTTRLLVFSRPRKFLSSLMAKKTPQPALLNFSADQGNDTVVVLGFPFESRV